LYYKNRQYLKKRSSLQGFSQNNLILIENKRIEKVTKNKIKIVNVFIDDDNDE